MDAIDKPSEVIECQCTKCGAVFNFSERKVSGNGLSMFVSPCCGKGFHIINKKISCFLRKNIGVNNEQYATYDLVEEIKRLKNRL